MNSADSTIDTDPHAETNFHLNLEAEQLSVGDLICSRFRLCRPLGSGGMGTVWLAEQLTPVKRSVAIKFLRPEVRNPRVVARFAREHQALAMMNHPHVAQVYEGGETDDFQIPFLVMEFVDGFSITEYCDIKRLSIRERLRILVDVCGAVEHAHQRGIIHRDLKPNNVFVTEGPNGPSPKVIDFGLAMTLPWSEMENSSIAKTIPGTAVGTPSYMAPEQVSAGNTEISTRTDVYALGVLLFELITGEVPFGSSHKSSVCWLDTFNEIMHAEPMRPSRRVETVENKAAIAAARNTSPRELAGSLRKELDWVVLRAIEKLPELRYESVGAFKKDLQRVIDDKPVDAHPPSIQYQLTKVIRQHLLTTVGCASIFLALCIGLIGAWRGQTLARAAEMESRLALAAERMANERARLAIAALTDALSSVSFSDTDSQNTLVAQVYALHELSECNSHRHDFYQPVVTDDKQELTDRIQKLREAVRILDHMDDRQSNPAYRSVLANVQFHLARTLERSGSYSKAEAEYRSALAEMQRMNEADHEPEKHKLRIAAICQALGSLLVATERQPEGLRLLDRAENLRR